MLSLNKHYNLGTLLDEQVDQNWDDIEADVNQLSSRLPQNNYSATTNPTVNDDVTQGYSNGSLWYNRTTDTAFVLTNASSTSANWVERDSISASDLGTAAFSDIVGTVSQSGGVPTGSLFERGSNANGWYTNFADGSAFRFAEVEVDVTSTSTQLFDLPASLSTTGDRACSISHLTGFPNSALQFSNIVSVGISGGSFFVRLASSGTSSDPTSNAEKLRLFASGRWFS